MAPRPPSEEELGRKWDRCLIDTTFKTVGGAVFGSLFSLLFFKRSAWPITLGVGIGLGAGYSNCRHQFLRHGHHGPPFKRPPWGRPFWRKPDKDSDRDSSWRGPRKEEATPIQPSDSPAESKDDSKPTES